MARSLLHEGVRMMRLAPADSPRSRARRVGFTLVELMIVVAIVGVLAVIAVVGYRKLVLSGKVTEAKNVISGIRIAQESYKVERGIYANIGTALCPLATSGTTQSKTQWDPACSGGVTSWSVLPVHVDGPVQFGYATSAGAFAAAPPALVGQPVGFVSIPNGVASGPWYFVTASADLDANGGLYTELVGTSWENTIFVNNEGM